MNKQPVPGIWDYDSFPEDSHGEIMCDSCGGTGVEEGCEWSGDPCHECRGRCFLPCDCYDCQQPLRQDGKR